ncbi:MAG: hypothetical protein ACFFD7_06485 [Candidatus Thorarchaeota archaeon]
MVKDIEKVYRKAEKLYNAMQYKRAAKIFNDVGDSYLKLDKFELARDCYFDAAKCSMKEDKYLIGLDFLRKAGNASLFRHEFLEANQFFREALNYIPNLRSTSDRNQNYVLFSCLSFLCHFVKGEKEEGLKIVKRTKSSVDDKFFKENSLIHLITNLTMVSKEKHDKYIERIKKDFNNLKFRDAEIILVKQALVIGKTYTSLIIELKLDKEVYTTNEVIKLFMYIDSNPLSEITQQEFYNYVFDELKIIKIGVTLSENLSNQKRPDVPIIIQSNQKKEINFIIKPHFQIEESIIGPFSLDFELSGGLIFTYDYPQLRKPKLISPPPSLDISIKNLRPPLINQSFPLEVSIENNSEGDALNLNIEIEFPEPIKLMRGTLKKQIYSLRSNENIKWEINLKPTEAGDYVIKVKSKFNDPDQNLIEEIKEFPFPIKL